MKRLRYQPPVESHHAELLECMLEQWADGDYSAFEKLKGSGKTQVLAFTDHGGAESDFVLKEFHLTLWHRIGIWLGFHRSLQTFEASQSLQKAGVGHGEVVGVFQEGSRVAVVQYFLQDCRDLSHLAIDGLVGQTEFEYGVESLARLHKYGLKHGDTKIANLMLPNDASARTLETCYWIDIEAVTTSPSGSKAQAKDVARYMLAASEYLDDHACETLLSIYRRVSDVAQKGFWENVLAYHQNFYKEHTVKYQAVYKANLANLYQSQA